MKNSKRIISFILLIALSVCVFVACSKASADGKGTSEEKAVVEIAEGYVKSATSFDYAKAASYMGKEYEGEDFSYSDELTSQLIEVLTKDADASEKPAIEAKRNDLKDLISTHILSKVSYKIDKESLEITGDTAKLKYTITVPDMKVIKEELEKEIKGRMEVGGDPQPKGITKIECLETVLTASDIPSLTKTQSFVMTLERKADKWIVVSDEQSK